MASLFHFSASRGKTRTVLVFWSTTARWYADAEEMARERDMSVCLSNMVDTNFWLTFLTVEEYAFADQKKVLKGAFLRLLYYFRSGKLLP